MLETADIGIVQVYGVTKGESAEIEKQNCCRRSHRNEGKST